MTKWVEETLYSAVRAVYQNDETLYQEKTDHQDMILFKNLLFGTMLTLDGVTQVTTSDEFVYHEMMTHVPLFTHPNPETVLIIGGGDGGIAREVLRHPSVKKAVMVEIDGAVVEFSKQHLPTVSNGVFNNPKLDLRIDDGAAFVATTDMRFDAILVDSTDPIGPGAVLFTHEFYTNCKRCLTAGGILVTQNGVPFMQSDELKQSVSYFRDIFAQGGCYLATIPTYAFGQMALGWATDADYSALELATIQKRFAAAGFACQYYNPETHKAAFALPEYIRQVVESARYAKAA